MLEVGQILPNGAEVLASTHEVVLAKFRGEFVTWKWGEIEGKVDCYWGHYHDKDIVAAAKEYEERAGLKVNEALERMLAEIDAEDAA